MRNPLSSRGPLVVAMATAVACALVVGLAGGATAVPAERERTPLSPRTTFVVRPDGSSGATARGVAIPNIDSVKATIRAYYAANGKGRANKTASPYISEVAQLLDDLTPFLTENASLYPQPAIVLDVDDTLLWNYDMEDGELHFHYDPAVQNKWVQEQRFPAVPGMVAFVQDAVAMGYAVFGVTGRTSDQEAATLANLTKVGFGTTFTADNLFTKWTGQPGDTQPDYITCVTASCTTVEYKSGTRGHIESLGYKVVLNIGDQWSDLKGRNFKKVQKMPNPTYYLPSPNLPDLDQPSFVPHNVFTVEADGSSGKTEGGEGIPNFDSVEATVRAYYAAPQGIANKKSSPYISEMKKLRDTWVPVIKDRCATQRALGRRPAVVFDVDDTTLWTYDMEDAAMHFNFDPALQNEWVQAKRFKAVPAMPAVVRAAKRAGCKVIGITGRRDDQRVATLRNLRKYYGNAFRWKWFFTKWADGNRPGYISCRTPRCTRVEFKSQTRAHVERLGLRIILNLGDQHSDLIGGHGKPVKLPNPTYYLP